MPPPSQKIAPLTPEPSVSPRNSSAPLLQGQQAAEQNTGEVATATDSIDPKTGKRRLFGFGKKKEEKQSPAGNMDTLASDVVPQVQAPNKNNVPDLRPSPIPISPSRHPYPSAVAPSPSRIRSSSPRMQHSPASSEIFERNVQEPVPISTLHGELDQKHLATHVITEDHIPPALEASAQAITSEDLDPDEVEIVTASAHLPAAASVLEGSTSHADLTSLQSPVLAHAASDASDVAPSLQQSGVLPGASEDEGASNYGQLDPNDVRRLSFISFADVVQSEHQQLAASQLGEIGSRDSLYIGSLPSSVPSATERAASPLRSPRSPASTHSQSVSGGVVTPPPGVNINPIGEQSPARSITGIPPPNQHGELTIETMRQAVRKTASGDLSNVRSPAMSPISDENSFRETRSRTNT
jgi:hypothetical protein